MTVAVIPAYGETWLVDHESHEATLADAEIHAAWPYDEALAFIRIASALGERVEHTEV